MARPRKKPAPPSSRSGVRRVRRLSATEVARRFSEVVSRVLYEKETVIVERGKEPVCEIGPVRAAVTFTGADLVGLLGSLPDPGEEYLEAVEATIQSQPPADETRWRR